MSLSERPTNEECFDYHRDYVAKVPDGDILSTLQDQLKTIPAFILGIPPAQLEVVHAPYEWKVRTVVEHCCDAERVFGYRILRFATGDTTPLPGWDENHYASCGYSTGDGLEQIGMEYATMRMANIQLLKRLTPEAHSRIGVADGRKMSVKTIAWLMAGHWIHHQEILEKRLAGT